MNFIKTYLFAFLTVIASFSQAQDCSPAGNVAIFSNYDGGPLIIDINQNIPNLKIGIASYEPVSVTFTGTFAGNVTEVLYAGYEPFQQGNDHCSGILITNITGPPNATVEVLNYPPVTLLSPLVDYFGFQIEAGNNGGIIGCYTCENNTYQGGANTAEQVIDYFLSEFGGELLFLKTQYGCWCGVQNLDQPASCCQPLNETEPGVSITAVPSLSLCDANSITLDAGPGYNSYMWSSGETTQTIQVTVAGTYSVSISSDCGQASTEVTIEPCSTELEITLADQTVCIGEEAILEAVVSGGTPPFSFSWSPSIGFGAGPYSVIVVPPGAQYTVTVTDATGTTAFATANITVISEEVFTGLGPDQDLCNPPVILDATTTFAQAYLWNTGATSPTITVQQPGSYSVEVTGQCGTYEDEILISECVGPLSVTLSNQEICLGETAVLDAFAQGGLGPYTYSWSPNVGNSASVNIAPASTTSYTVTVTDDLGTQATATAIITVISENLSINLGDDAQLCAPPLVLNATNDDALGYSWNTGATSPSITVNQPGTYAVTIQGSCGTFTDEITLSECLILTVTLQGQSICPGQSAVMEAVVAGGQGPFQYQWSPPIGTGPGPYFVSPEFTEVYTVSVIDSEGTTAAATATVNIISESIELPWEENLEICPGVGIQISAEISSAQSYLWSTGAIDPEIFVYTYGVYSVEISTLCQTITRTVDVNFVAGAEVPAHQLEFISCLESGPVVIGWTQSDAYTLVWETGAYDNSIQVDESGIYSAIYEGPCGAKEVNYSVVIEQCECDIFIPNAFTPNGDGINDTFKPMVNCETSEYELLIFNRWGNLVFESTAPETVWNGSFNDSEYFSPEGVYVYTLRVRPLVGLIVKDPVERAGSITMIR